MSKNVEIQAQSRKDEGKGASRRLRRASFVPAVVYGAGKAPESIQIEHNTILLAAKNESFFSSIINLNVDGAVQKVLVRDWQKHPFKQQMMHMDFQRIRAGEKLHTSIPLHFIGQEQSPAAKTSGVVVSHNITEIEVACLAEALPEYIDVDLSSIDQGDMIHLSELNLPEGVEIPDLQHGPEHDRAVVTVHAVKVEVEPETEETEAAAEGAEGAESAAKEDQGESSDEKTDEDK
jgi:large subunit ribosomal protein L25